MLDHFDADAVERSAASAGMRAAPPISCRTNVIPQCSAAGQNSTRMSRPLK
jgi:hypothetical protein